MKRNKLILAVVCLAMAFALCALGCANKASNEAAEAPADEQVAAEAEAEAEAPADAAEAEAPAEVAAPDNQIVAEGATATDPYVNDATCMSCHGGSYEAVAALLEDYGDSNPHNSIHGGYEPCSTCHEKGSEVTENRCLYCHDWPRDLDSNPYD